MATTLTRLLKVEERREALLPMPSFLKLGKHDDIDAGELLQHGEEDCQAEVRPGALLEHGPPWPLHLLRRLTCLHKVPELGLNVLGALDSDQVGDRLLLPAPLDVQVGVLGRKHAPIVMIAAGTMC